MKTPSITALLEAGVHFGHKTSRWHPKMQQFLFGDRNGIHIIDLEKTNAQMVSVLEAVRVMASEGKTILFVTTKPQAKEVVKAAALRAGMPFLVERWLGGLLTNFSEMKRLLKKYNTTKAEQASGELERYTKSEQVRIGKELVKQDETLGGIATLERMPDAIFLPSMHKEKTAVTEANATGVPIIAVCDTNADPSKVTYCIPGNDDGVKSITLLVNAVADAVIEGRKEWEKKKSEGVNA